MELGARVRPSRLYVAARSFIERRPIRPEPDDGRGFFPDPPADVERCFGVFFGEIIEANAPRVNGTIRAFGVR